MEQYKPEPVETSSNYKAFIEYLKTKDSPKAQRLLERLLTFKTVDEYVDFKEYLIFDLLIEIS